MESGKLLDVLRWVREEAGDEDIRSLLMLCLPAALPARPVSPPYEEAASPPVSRRGASCAVPAGAARRVSMATGPVKKKVAKRKSNVLLSAPKKPSPGHELQEQDAAGRSAEAVSEQIRVLGNYDNADVLNVLLSSLSSGAVSKQSSTGISENAFKDSILCDTTPLGLHLPQAVRDKIVREAYKAYGGIAWFIYDDRFRQKMSIQRSIPWGSKDIDLWMGMLIPRFQPQVSQALGVQQSAGSSRDALPELFMGPCAARVQRWLTCSLADKTWQSYLGSWCKWIAFKDGLHRETGLGDRELILWLILEQGQAGYSASSIQKHLAGISFWLKLLGLEDVTKSFLLKQILKGISRMGRSSDTRKPITLLILNKLLAALPQVCFSPYEQVLFRVLFIFCFFAALRVSEAVSSSKSIPGGLQWGDVTLVNGKLRLLIRSSKTDQSGKAFAAIRPSVCGPFFVHADGSSLTKYHFTKVLHDCIVRVGLSPNDYKTHSFRIGAATQASILGFSDMSIQKLGRWSSKRFFSYVRPALVDI
ncbi:hypothetical protein XELAEV_18001723mg [Xenopus laevis]|nr:hypothetical protein XELAEV_18001723mg [Xenopus laevis]